MQYFGKNLPKYCKDEKVSIVLVFFVVSHLWALAKTGKQIGGYFENGESFRGGLAKVNDNEFINTQGKSGNRRTSS